jgi:hypothetical protein
MSTLHLIILLEETIQAYNKIVSGLLSNLYAPYKIFDEHWSGIWKTPHFFVKFCKYQSFFKQIKLIWIGKQDTIHWGGSQECVYFKVKKARKLFHFKSQLLLGFWLQIVHYWNHFQVPADSRHLGFCRVLAYIRWFILCFFNYIIEFKMGFYYFCAIKRTLKPNNFRWLPHHHQK